MGCDLGLEARAQPLLHLRALVESDEGLRGGKAVADLFPVDRLRLARELDRPPEGVASL